MLGVLGGKEGESLDDKHGGKGRVCEGSARERKGGQQAYYRLLLLTADLGLSGDVDSLALSLSLCVCVGVCVSLSVCLSVLQQGAFGVRPELVMMDG